MKLLSREAPTHGLDRVRLTEDVAERHAGVVDVLWRRGKRAALASWACLGLGCASEPPPKPVEPPPPPVVEPAPTASTTATMVLTSPIDESRKALASALATTDAHERCRLLLEATLLDASSFEAQKARAESRCAPAAELLPNARAAFALKKDSVTATLLATVALRAGARADAMTAADALEALDMPDKLAAARMLAKLGEHLRSAKIYADVAAARAAKGATTDALDARLDAVIETARAQKPAAAMLEEALGAANTASKGYGDAWVAPKVVEAIAAVRNAGEPTDALAKKALKSGLFAGPIEQDSFALERAIAEARAGKPLAAQNLATKMRGRVSNPAVRALFTVLARVNGSCADAKAHARAHAWLSAEGMRLDDDVAWARACESTGKIKATVVAPIASDEVADMRAIADADPLHARARLDAITKAHPDDVAAWLAFMELAAPYDRAKVAAAAVAALPNEPWIALADLPNHPASARDFGVKVLGGVIESGLPRAIAPIAAKAMLVASDDPGLDDVAEALVLSCANDGTSACLEGDRAPALGRATFRMRKSRAKLFAVKGVALSQPDLALPRVRLDLSLSLVVLGDNTKAAIFANTLSAPESALVKAFSAASSGKCVVVPEARKNAQPLANDYADVFAAIDGKCK